MRKRLTPTVFLKPAPMPQLFHVRIPGISLKGTFVVVWVIFASAWEITLLKKKQEGLDYLFLKSLELYCIGTQEIFMEEREKWRKQVREKKTERRKEKGQ